MEAEKGESWERLSKTESFSCCPPEASYCSICMVKQRPLRLSRSPFVTSKSVLYHALRHAQLKVKERDLAVKLVHRESSARAAVCLQESAELADILSAKGRASALCCIASQRLVDSLQLRIEEAQAVRLRMDVQHEDKMSVLCAEYQWLEASVKEWQEKCATAEGELKEWQGQSFAAAEQVLDWQGRCSTVEEEAKDWKGKCAAAEGDAQEWQAKCIAAEEEAGAWRGNAAAVEEHLKEWKAKCTAAEEEARQWQGRYAEAEQQFQLQIDAQTTQQRTLEESLEEATTKLNASEAELSLQATRITEALDLSCERKHHVQDLERQLLEAATGLEASNQCIADLQMQLRESQVLECWLVCLHKL